MKKTIIEQTIDIAKKVQPDLWNTAEKLAKIIDPGAYTEWNLSNKDMQRSLDAKQKYKQSVALHKAMEVLKALNLAEDFQWEEVLSELSKRNEP